MSDSLYRCRPLVLSGILLFWAVCMIDGTPASSPVHEKLDDLVDPMLCKVSLWQNDWALFAPDIDHWNSKIECIITWDDGSQTVWSHADWTTAGWWEKFRQFRHMEYYESLILANGQPAWPAFADITIHRVAEETGKSPRLAELVYYGDTISPPEKVWRQAYSAPQFEPSPLKFYTWYPNAISESEIRFYGN